MDAENKGKNIWGQTCLLCLCTFTILQGHFYLLCTVMVTNINFGSGHGGIIVLNCTVAVCNFAERAFSLKANRILGKL